jgi:leucyl/phenylalanyl-tRNA--protein transferase
MPRDDLYASISADLIEAVYHFGMFPMASGRYGPIDFYSTHIRGIIPLDERFTVRRSLRQELKKAGFEIRFDTVFRDVILACARWDLLPDDEVWISEEIIELYCDLYSRGRAHSVEVFKDDILVGGLYGLTFGGAFCGESMFSRVPFASQAALVALVERLRAKGFTLLDAQTSTDHLKQFGLYETSHEEYMKIFTEASQQQTASFLIS